MSRKIHIENIQFELLRLKYQSKLNTNDKEYDLHRASEEEKQAMHQKVVADLEVILNNIRTIAHHEQDDLEIMEQIKLPIYQMFCLFTLSPYAYEHLIYQLVDLVYLKENEIRVKSSYVNQIAGELYDAFYIEANPESDCVKEIIDYYKDKFKEVEFWSEFPTYFSAFRQQHS